MAASARGPHHHLGRRRARLARRRMAGRAGRPRRPRAGRARSYRARPSRYLRDRRYRRRSAARTASRCPASRRRPSSRDVMSPARSRRGWSGSTRRRSATSTAGSLAQIGKRKAVIDFGRIKLRGTLAWWIWGIAHIYFLIGLRNRLSVALSWLWIHARDQRAARLITQGSKQGWSSGELATRPALQCAPRAGSHPLATGALTSPARIHHPRSGETPGRPGSSKPAGNSRTDTSILPASSPRTDTSDG